MGLKAMVKVLDGLPDAVKPLYRREGEGDKAVYLLDVEAVDGWELTGSGLKSALGKLRDEREALAGQLEGFKGLDAAKARDALAKVEAMKSWTPEDKVLQQIEAKTRELAAAKDIEIGALKQQLDALNGRYREVRINAELTDAAAKARFVAPHLAPRLFGDRIQLNEKLEPVVIGANGKPLTRILNDGTILPVTIAEFVAEQARLDDYKPLVAGNNATGTQGSTGHVNNQQQRGSVPPASPGLDHAAALDRLASELARVRQPGGAA